MSKILSKFLKIMELFLKFCYLISEERKNKKFEEVLSRVKEKNEAYEEDFL